MKQKEKFECYECGVYYWVNDRDDFDCPNCEDFLNIIDEKNNTINIKTGTEKETKETLEDLNLLIKILEQWQEK